MMAWRSDRSKKISIKKLTSVFLVAAMLFTISSCARKKETPEVAVQESEQIFLINDDAPVCNMIISDEVFKVLTNGDQYSYILDMMNDYFNIIINNEIDPTIVYIKPVSEKISSEVRLEEVYGVSNKISIIIKLAETGKLMLDSSVDGSMTVSSELSTEKSVKAELTAKVKLHNQMLSALKKAANKGAVYSVRAIKEEFKRKTAEIYGSKELLSGDKVKSLRYNDYVINTDNEAGISIVCGSLDSVIEALNYFLSEYVQMGSSNEGNYLIDVPDSAVHVGHYLSDSIADKSIKNYTIIYYCDKSYYDSRENAKYLQTYFVKNYGVELVAKDSDSSKDIKYKIVIGKTRLSVSETYYNDEHDIMDYEIRQLGDDLYIMGSSDWAIRYAINYLIDEFFSKEIPVPIEFYQKGAYDIRQLAARNGGSEIRIMSNNVWDCNINTFSWMKLGENCYNTNRYKTMARLFRAYKPDILSMQEMNIRPVFSNAMLNEINKEGGHYLYVDRYSSGYDIGCLERNCTPIAYNADTLTLLAAGESLYPKNGNNKQSKSFTWGYFEKKDNGFRFLVFSTHLWWMSDKVYKGSSDIRISQMKILNKQANELIEEYGCPCFIMGDFNCNTVSREFGVLEKLGFTDCHSIAEDYASNECGRYVCNASKFSYKQNAGTYKKNALDHILVKNLKKAKVLYYDYVTPNFYGKLSDHAPVYIDVKMI